VGESLLRAECVGDKVRELTAAGGREEGR